MYTKINQKGQYCLYPGTTIVSMIDSKDLVFWQKIHDSLMRAKTICKYFSPLPFTSYHMTLVALDTVVDAGEQRWELYIDTRLPKYQELHNDLIAIYQSLQEVRVRILREDCGITLDVMPSDLTVDENLKLSKKHGIMRGVPQNYHITLAYQFKDISSEDHKLIVDELRNMQTMFKQKGKIQLEPPRVYYFRGMTEFILWDAKENPFNNKILKMEDAEETEHHETEGMACKVM